MRRLLVFFTIICLLGRIYGKPLRAIESHDSDTGEAEYENNDDLAAEDYSQDDQEAPMDSQERVKNSGRRQTLQGNSRLPDLSNNPYKQHLNPHAAQLANLDNFSELSGASRDMRNEKTTNTNLNVDFGSALRYQQPNEYIESNEQEATRQLSDNGFKLNRVQNLGYENGINKRAKLSLNANEEGELLFDNNRNQLNKMENSPYSRAAPDASVHSRYLKQLYNTVPGALRDFPEYKKYQNLHLNINRDRRQVPRDNKKETNEPTLSPDDSKELDTANDNEESAIKRHVKKLSEQELEQLFNSLSEEKRTLLKKIIETDYDNDNEGKNKREITKKAGAVEENNYIENGQSDSSKIQGGSPNVDVNTDPSIPHETTDNNKRTMSPTETGEVISTKTPSGSEKPENKVELINQNEDLREPKSEINLDFNSKKSENRADFESDTQIDSKIENKREANISEIVNRNDKSFDSAKSLDCDYTLKDIQGSMNNQELFSHDDDEISDLIDEETDLQNPYQRNYKRDTSLTGSSDLSVSIKSLEESFPNSNAYDESNVFSGSKMAPLVRVKRKNAESANFKRSANVIADSNVPYFPNKGENDDEDNDEGGEFDEDGFYDRTSNYARSNENQKSFDVLPHCLKAVDKTPTQRESEEPSYGHDNDNIEDDSKSLGSDTDDAMTGIEGVNDNLMYSSGSRSKRASEENLNVKNSSEEKPSVISTERRLRSTPLTEGEAKTITENYIKAPGLQENDAFGPLPRNYEGDLGRYKRIRCVKQSPIIEENNSLNE